MSLLDKLDASPVDSPVDSPADGRTDRSADIHGIAAKVVGSRHRGPDADDLVQEAWVRVATALGRRQVSDPAGYTAGVAANLVRAAGRREATAQRWAPRLYDADMPEPPERAVLEREEADAVATALGRLPAPARDALVAHVVDGLDTIQLASLSGSTPGAVAACLARARAMLRVEYVLAYRRLPSPDDRCRRILYAISAADARRIVRLGAEAHVLRCESCASVAAAVRERRRPAMGVPLLLRLVGWDNGDLSAAAQHPALVGGLVGAGLVGALAIGASVLAPLTGGAGSTAPAAASAVASRPAAAIASAARPVPAVWAAGGRRQAGVAGAPPARPATAANAAGAAPASGRCAAAGGVPGVAVPNCLTGAGQLPAGGPAPVPVEPGQPPAQTIIATPTASVAVRTGRHSAGVTGEAASIHTSVGVGPTGATAG